MKELSCELMDPGQRKLSIIIVNHNTGLLLAECIASLKAYPFSGGTTEIIVVDSGSSDTSASLAKEMYPEISLHASRFNVGFSKGNNIGLELVTGDLILFLNPDTQVTAKALDRLCSYLCNNPKTGAVGGRLTDRHSNVQPSAGSALTLGIVLVRVLGLKKFIPIRRIKKSKLGARLQQMLHFADYEQEREVQVLVGACILTRREVLEEVGCFDERFFLFYEESDWCSRVRSCGWKIAYLPEAHVLHHIAQSTSKVLSVSYLAEYDSLLYYFIKNHSAIETFILRLVVSAKMIALIFGDLLRVLLHKKGSLDGIRRECSVKLMIFMLFLANRPMDVPWLNSPMQEIDRQKR